MQPADDPRRSYLRDRLSDVQRLVPGRLLEWRPGRRFRKVLAEMHIFAGSDRTHLARAARWGDVVEVEAGDVLVREEHTDFWFFVILSGSVRVTRRAREVAVLHRGDHFGEIAIIGFRPQPATVRAVEPTVLFVLGRRYLWSLAALDVSIQRALFPSIEPGSYRAHVRELQDEGLRDWDRLVPPERRSPLHVVGDKRGAPRHRPPGRSLTWSAALDLLADRDLQRFPESSSATEATTRVQRLKFAPALVLAVFVAAFAALYHPPMAVVTPGRAVDVVQDISITGAEPHRPTGRYLLTPVNVDRPTVVGLFAARVSGKRIVRANAPATQEVDPATASRVDHEAFLRSHRQAVALAEKMLGVDAERVGIAIRDRGIGGPSAGLVYALAIADMLAPGDLAAGRVIAATGELRPDGTIAAVAFVSLKADAARAGGADVFVVPDGQKADVRGLEVVSVASLKDALRALEESARRA